MSPPPYTDPKSHKEIYNGKITLYKLSNPTKKTIYYRFADPTTARKYIRKSSGTNDYGDASRVAIEHYETLLVKEKLGLTSEPATITALHKKFINELPKSARSVASGCYRNYWLPYFKDQDLYNCDYMLLKEYVAWRTDPKNYVYNKSKADWARLSKGGRGQYAVAKGTLQGELKYLRFFLKQGHEAGLIKKLPNMAIRYKDLNNVSIQQTDQRRGRFTKDQIIQLRLWRGHFRTHWKSVLAGELDENGARKQIAYDHRINRFHLCMFYVLTTMVSNCGLRPMEAKRLRWGHFKKRTEGEDTYTFLHITKKVAKKMRNGESEERQAIFSNMEEMWDIMEDFKVEWTQCFGREPRIGEHPDDSDLIFPSNRDVNKERRSLSIVVKNGLIRAGNERGCILDHNFIDDPNFPNQKAKKGLGLYSLRSHYITTQLTHGTPLYQLSLCVGSAPSTIIKTYAVDQATQYWRIYTKHIREMRAKAKEEL